MLIGTQDGKIVDSKDDEKIVGSYLRLKCVNSDSLFWIALDDSDIQIIKTYASFGITIIIELWTHIYF